MPQHPVASPDAIDLRRVFPSFLRKLPMLGLLALAAGGVTVGVLSTMAPQYLSQAQLRIRSNAGNDAMVLPDKEAVGSHVRGLMSTELALKMAKTLDLGARPEFNSALEPEDLYGQIARKMGVGGPKTGETDQDRLMQAYFKSVRAYQVRETRSIMVDCTSSNARFAATCANTLAELYRDGLRGRTVSESTDVRGKLVPEVARLNREAVDAESQVTEFRGKANLFQGSTQATQLKDQQLTELSAELTRVSTTRGEADARAQAAREMSARGIAAANPDVQKSTLIPRMEEQRVTLERQIAELSATLLPGHPRMKQLNAELHGLQTQIRAEVLKVVDSLGNDARIAADREAGVRRRVDELKRTMVSAAPDTARLTQLEAQAKSKRTELERIQRQYETAASTAASAVAPVEVEIVSEAYASNEKVFPKIGSMAAFVSIGVFIIGSALAFTRELMRGARALPAPARVSAPPALELPAAGLTSNASATRSAQTTSASASTTPQAVAEALLGKAQGGRGYRVLLTGRDMNVQAARAASLVAERLGASGAKVLLVAWTGAGDTLARLHTCPPQPGTAELLAGAAALDQTIHTNADGTFDILTAGHDEGHTADADSAAMVLDALDELYQVIIVLGPEDIARDLFEAMQGRFDAGVLARPASDAAPSAALSGTFLGFHVPDLPVLSLTVDANVARPQRTETVGTRVRSGRLSVTA